MTFSKRIKPRANLDKGQGYNNSTNFCGVAPTGDPRVFGPPTWKAFHLMAQNYPENPNLNTIKQCSNFVKAIPYMIPCSQCGYHFQEFTEKYYKNNPTMCNSRQDLVKFFVEAHNNVSSFTSPERKPWTCEDAEKEYTSVETCFHSRGWGGKELCRESGCAVKAPIGGILHGFK